MSNQTENSSNYLATQIARVADALEEQNHPKTRLFAGLLFGVGTAIGAGIIASLLIFVATQILQSFGIDLSVFTT